MSHAEEIAYIKETQALLLQTQRTITKVLASTTKLARETAATLQDAEADRKRARQADAERQAEFERDMKKRQAEHEAKLARDMEASKQRMDRVELVLAEVGDKLNGLIGYMDGRHGANG